MSAHASDSSHYDALETRDAESRARDLAEVLPKQIAHAQQNSRAYAEMLAEVDPRSVTDLQALAKLPVTRKQDIMDRQSPQAPLGGFNASEIEAMARLFASPGPVYEPQGIRPDHWRMARGLYAAGFHCGMVVHNSFAYHLTPGGWIMDSGARALGCPVIPAGTGNSAQQAAAIHQLRPAAFTGTPDYLKVLLDKADELGLDASSIERAMVSGGPLFPSLRQEYSDRGVLVRQCYATADLGLVAYETTAPDGGPNPGMVVDEGVLVEIVRPGTGDPVADGEVGELVVTTFNPDYPLIRFATGDMSAVLSGSSPCGRTNTRIKGWMGRADQTAKVKGMFVHPQQIARVSERHPEIQKARAQVTRENAQDVLTLVCEVAGGDQRLAEAIAGSLHEATQLKGAVAFVEPGELPNDGIVIDDQRESAAG
ncbi:phenylacetate--CoA ligase family protein [Rhodovibrio salinarum]|uniref:AMP-dependent synthetase n=1 Tax=Rhodovibrio salinarum TaxID=1087 RepID=A0A934QHR6_9PROT|nr:AMP-binding protein [Rhodovibrio salinarum]MBK1697008.1 AMP-dependent synthetase [Rhodovibrio salinarum]